MIPPSLFTTGSFADSVLFKLCCLHSRESILLQILRQISARKHSQASFNTYTGDSSTLYSGLSCRGWLEVNCGETSHWEILLLSFRKSHWLAKLLPSTSVWCLDPSPWSPQLHILFRNMGIHQWKQCLLTDFDPSFASKKDRTIIQHRVCSHWFSFSCREGAPSTTSVSIPALFQEIKYRSKIAVTHLKWLSEHLQKSDCLPVKWIISQTSLGNVPFQPVIKLCSCSSFGPQKNSQDPFIEVFSLPLHECTPLLANVQYLSLKLCPFPFKDNTVLYWCVRQRDCMSWSHFSAASPTEFTRSWWDVAWNAH